jgi:hypothetical protein
MLITLCDIFDEFRPIVLTKKSVHGVIISLVPLFLVWLIERTVN